MNEQRPGMFVPALIGGAIAGVLAGIPIINCLCCLWIIGGGMLAAFFLTKESRLRLSAGDGAIVGIDLAGMVRNAKAAFGMAKKGEKRPRTDFTELSVPFTITKGVVKTPNTTLMSPLLRVRAAGKAKLVKEKLDFRVEPKFVGTIKGQGDKMDRAGVMVPVLITGRFDSPKFRPDLEGMIKTGLKEGIPKTDELQKLLPGKSGKKGGSKTLEDTAKGLLKGLKLGQ